jgi:hypothetical protein
MLQKKSFKNPFYEKDKMTTEGPLCLNQHMQWGIRFKLWPYNYVLIIVFLFLNNLFEHMCAKECVGVIWK